MNNIKFFKTTINLLIMIFFLGLFLNYTSPSSQLPLNTFGIPKSQWITITLCNEKTALWLMDTHNHTLEKLIDNKDVIVTGCVNSTGNTLIYSDAIADSPWDVFKLDIKTKEISQVTNDIYGQFNLHFGDDNGNVIYSKCGSKASPVPTISKIDIINNYTKFFTLPNDLAIEDFDVRNNKIVAIVFSFNEFITKRFKEQNNTSKLQYSIIEMDQNGENITTILNIDAVSLSSISFSASGKDLILGGNGVINDEAGFYKLNLKNKTITTLLTETELKQTCHINSLYSYKCCLSYNEENIYFTAIPKDAIEVTILGMTTPQNAFYRYNLREKKEYELFSSPNSVIFSFSFTYR